ncbi:MAG: hypothetical protein JXR19_07750 [Bacteroidia bacterium]
MKKTTILAFALLASALGKADIWDPEVYQVGKLYPGYVIKKSGDTLEGFVKALTYYGDENSNQSVCYYYKSEDQSEPTLIYKPPTLQGYKIGDKIYKTIPKAGLLKSSTLTFVLLEEEGAISTYGYYWYENCKNTSDPNCKTGIKKNTHFYNVDWERSVDMQSLTFGFKKKFPELIKDHPEMAEKVAKKEKGYKFFNIYALIEEYNKFKAEGN